MRSCIAGLVLVAAVSFAACIDSKEEWVDQGVTCGSGAGSGTCSADAGSCPGDWPEPSECGEGQTCPPADAGPPDAAPPTDGGGSGSGSASARMIEPDFLVRDLEAGIPTDSPGCDWFPDTVCTTYCCAQHDRCYDTYDCSSSSWCTGQGGQDCDDCNNDAVECILDYGLIGCKINWPFDGRPRACEDFPCGCNYQECYDDDTGETYCAKNCR